MNEKVNNYARICGNEEYCREKCITKVKHYILQVSVQLMRVSVIICVSGFLIL